MSQVPPLQISVAKRNDGFAVLRCTRSDDTTTWQKQRGQFFAYHDLIHYAVESVWEVTQGFFGLIASGWDIEDTTGKGARGPLPEEALRVELLVGLLAADLQGGGLAAAAELVEQGRTFGRARGEDVDLRLAQAELDRMRIAIDQLHAQWAATPGGESLRLVFPDPSLSSASGQSREEGES